MNVPKIRFNDFDDNIIKISIKELGNVITGTTPSTTDRSNYGDEYLWASPVDMGDFKYINNTKTKLSEKGFNKTRCVPKDSILITCIGSTIGKTGMASKEMSTNQQINTLIPNKIYNSDYLYYCINFNFPRFLNKISFQAVPIISKSEFEKLEVSITKNIYEQEKIGKLLSLLDKKIELQSKKIEDLKLFKKGLHDKLFNEVTGNDYLLSDIAVFENGKGHENIIDENGKYILINSKFISTEGNVTKKCSEQLTPLFKNDITMVMSDLPNGKALAKCYYIDENNKYSLNQRICKIKVKDDSIINSKYLFYLLNRNSYYLRFDDGVNQTNLKKDDILSLNLVLPSIKDQERDSKTLTIIDNFIEKENNKLSKLFLLKKGLMQSMFV